MFSQLYSIYVKNMLNFANFGAKKGLNSLLERIKPLLSIWCPRWDSNPHGIATNGF